MTCHAPVRECLALHWKPHLQFAKITKGGFSIQARCPEHGGGKESLTVSAGERWRITWHCWDGCGGDSVRRAILRAGVPASCVPTGNGREVTQGQVIDAAILDPKVSPITRLIRVHAIRLGHVHWPGGKTLIKIADDLGFSKPTAYRAKEAGPLVTEALTRDVPTRREFVKRGRSDLG